MGNLIAITWALSPLTGWGKVGLALHARLATRGDVPLLLSPPSTEAFPPEQAAALMALHAPVAPVLPFLVNHPDQQVTLSPAVMLHAFGNDLGCDETLLRAVGSHRVGLAAIENTRIAPARVDRARAFDTMVVHSRFNRDLLAAHGLTNLALTYQGIDPTLFHPRPATGRFGDRFVVFSGGKVEYRKGQDLVVAAFARFAARHPDTLLVCAWASFWPDLAYGVNDGVLARPLVAAGDGRPDIRRWLAENGVPAANALVLDHYTPAELAALLPDCHVALFPNRCEGCTNLVAMETMAAGVPTLLSANTGHLDLLDAGCGMALTTQHALPDPDGQRQGWGESDVDEMVARLEEAHARHAQWRAAAVPAAATIARRTWDRFAAVTLAAAEAGDPGEPGLLIPEE